MFYERDSIKQRNEKRIVRLKKFSRVINPLICVGFVIVFRAVGMQHYYQEIQIEQRIGRRDYKQTFFNCLPLNGRTRKYSDNMK